MIKPDHKVENLVLSKPTEGSVAKATMSSILACALALMAPAPSIAANDNAPDQESRRPTFAAEGLPPGINIDPSTGIISGNVDRAAISDGKMVYNIQILVRDINGASARSTINVVLPNELPFAGEDFAIVKVGVPAILSVLDNDIDADGDQLALMSVASSQSSKVTVVGRSVIFTALKGSEEEDIVTYTASDGHGGTATGRVRVLIAQ